MNPPGQMEVENNPGHNLCTCIFTARNALSVERSNSKQALRRSGLFVCCPMPWKWNGRYCPTSPFTILEPQNPWIEFYVVQESRVIWRILKLQNFERARRVNALAQDSFFHTQ